MVISMAAPGKSRPAASRRRRPSLLKLLIRIRDCFRNVCVDKVGHCGKQGYRSLRNGRYPLSPSGVLLPETSAAAKYVHK
jgi:hypothetical protein